MKKTHLYPKHKSLGARIIDYAGWSMPVSYEGTLKEHKAVRERCGIFDVSHMGEIILSGEHSQDLLQKITCNDVSLMEKGRVQYNALINDKGGVVDDITVYRPDDNKFLLCVNAANIEKDFSFIREKADSKTKVEDISEKINQLALQGPLAKETLLDFLKNKYPDLYNKTKNLKYYHFIEDENSEIIISRTGYTGEDGFEIYLPPRLCEEFWDAFLLNENCKPIGLAARDILRLEAKYPLYGHELNDERSIVESAQGWIVKNKTPAPTEQPRLLEQKEGLSITKKVCGFIMEEPGVAREHYKIFNEKNIEVGEVTSGAFSPVLNKSLGLAFINLNEIKDGNILYIKIRNDLKKIKIHLKSFINLNAGK